MFGIDCDGYDKHASNPEPQRNTLNTYSHPTQNIALAPCPSNPLRLENETEQRHFQTFQSQTAWDIAGIFESVFWQHIVLQECHQETFVLDAILALSAYNTSLKVSKLGRQDQASFAIASEHSQFALRKYQHSLQVMRASLNSDSGQRTALIACLLVCTFEGLLGNTLTTLSHARSGQTLVETFGAEYPHPKPREEGISSPASHIIEDKLFQAANYFETQIIGLFDGRSRENHARLKTQGSETISRMPEGFKDLGEAYLYWDLVLRRSMHFVSQCSGKSTDTTNFCTSNYAVKYGEKGIPFADTEITVERFGQYQYEQQRYLGDIARWSSSFGKLYSELKRATNKRLVIGSHTLHIQSMCAEIDVSSVLHQSLCSHDKYLSNFLEIVTIAKEIIKIKKTFSEAQFTVELGIIPCLHVVAMWCRDRFVRREAIALLNWYGIREGHWDARITAAIDKCLMELEENGILSEDIPEWARIRVVSVFLGEGGIIIEYVRGSPKFGETLGSKRITWPEDGVDIKTSTGVEAYSHSLISYKT